MAINLPLGLKMGFARNIERDRKEEEDAKANIKELNNLKRQWLFTTYQTDRAANSKSAKARSSLIKKAMGVGFTKEAAYLLESNGELGEQLSRIADLKGKGKLNKEKVNLMSKLVTDTLKRRPKEEQIAALKYIAQGDLNFGTKSEFEDEFINAIFSADPNSLNKATELYSTVMAGGGGGGVDFGASGLSSRSFGDYEATERSNIDKLIASKVQGFFGVDTFVYGSNDSVSFKGKDKGAAQELFNKMSRIVEQRYYDPSVAGDWKSVINDMADNLGKQARSSIPVRDYVISTDPNFNISTTNNNQQNNNQQNNSQQNNSTETITEELTKDTIDDNFLG